MYRIIGSDGKEYGPVTVDQIKQWLTEGRLNANSRVLAEGSSEWKSLSEFPELRFGDIPPRNYPVGPSAVEQVKGPAIGLMVTGGVGMLAQVIGIFANMFGMSFTQGLQQGNPDTAWVNAMSGTLGIIFGGIGIAIGVLIVFGAVKMQKLESRPWAMASSILAVIPCISPCCVLGLPLGIWALVVLAKPEVKAAFH